MTDSRTCITSLFLQNNDLGTPWYVNALGIYRKFEDKNRVDLVGTMRWLVPAEGLQFEDQYWIVIEPSPADSKRSSVVRTYYQLEVKNTGLKSTQQEKRTQNRMMESIAKISRYYLQFMQNDFLDQAGSVMEPSPTTMPKY